MPENPLKIGFVLDDTLDRPDGVQQYVLALGEWLRIRGHDIHYLTSTSNRQDVLNLHSLTGNLPVRFNGNSLRTPLPTSRRRIQLLLEREQFDILHIQMPYSPLLAGRIIDAASPQTAVIGTFHVVPKSRLVACTGRVLALWCRRTLQRFDNVCSVSVPSLKFANRVFGLTGLIVPNAICLDAFRESETLLRPVNAPVSILFLGRLVPRKGCLALLQAVKLLVNDPEVPLFHLTVCGKGPLGKRLKRFVQVNGIEDLVTFAGFVSEADKTRYYAEADITVFPSSDGESFGIVLLEAMASGRSAVLAGDNSGYSAVLNTCPYTVLFNPRDPVSLAALLRVLLTDQALRELIVAWQRRYVKQFDITQVGPQMLDVYTAALRRRNLFKGVSGSVAEPCPV